VVPGPRGDRHGLLPVVGLGLARYLGQFRTLATAANRQPAVAAYVRRPGDSDYRALGLDVLRMEGGQVVEITRFVSADLFPAFGLPLTL